ncbi:MAG TPA: response regulator [Thermodesulfobacteriota bacterium]|nr:response regulator [Thermodesulfobacteriota bacterium]
MAKDTILILDTDKHVTWTFKTLLENEEYPVIIADTIERALNNFSELQISGVITEFRIENVRTLEVIRSLKERFPETYVMMVTDEAMKEEEFAQIFNAGVDDFFLKPISIKKILLYLQKGLRNRSLLIERNRLEREMVAFHSKRGRAGIPETGETLPI